MLTGIIIRLRWPTALLAVVVLAALLASFRWTFWFGHTFISGSSYVFGALGNGKLSVHTLDAIAPLNPRFDIEPAAPLAFKILAFSQQNGSVMNIVAFFPNPAINLWAVAIPSVVLAAVGFAARRRRNIAGCCKRCRYPLRGASICPECGAGSAPAS